MSKFVDRYYGALRILGRTPWLVSVVLLFVAATLVNTHFEQGITAATGVKILDMQFSYTAQQAQSTLAALGSTGRSAYASWLWIDFAFAIAFALFQTTTIFRLADRISPALRALAFLPLVRGLLDLVEDALVAALLGAFPRAIPWLAVLAGTVTTTKWVLGDALIAIFLLLGVLSTWRSLRDKKRALAGSGMPDALNGAKA